MKQFTPLVLTIIAILPFCAQAEDAPDILLRGILKLKDSQAFSISDSAATESKWLQLGQSFGDFTLTAFDETNEVLTVLRGDQSYELSIAAAGTPLDSDGSADARLNEAKRMMDLMRFDKMMEDTIGAQMSGMGDMMRQQLSQLGETVDEDFIEFYSGAMTRMFEGIDWEPIKAGMTQAYAEVFTEGELAAMADFYTTPAGEASLTKMPEIQQKSMQVMMPAIMQATQKLQQELGSYMQEKANAGTAPTTGQ